MNIKKCSKCGKVKTPDCNLWFYPSTRWIEIKQVETTVCPDCRDKAKKEK